MISATANPSLFVCQLLADYLSADGSVEAGVPAVDVMPIKVMDGAENPSFPSLVIAAKEDKSQGPRKTLEASILLLTAVKSAAVDAASITSDTTRDQASAWLNAIDARLQDRAAFQAFLDGLTNEIRADWTFRKNPIWHGEQSPMRNKEMGTIYYALTATFMLWWERQPGPA
jgi:hypothetical protein